MCRHWRLHQEGGPARRGKGVLKFTPVAVLHPANFSRRRSLLAAKFIMKLERMAGIGPGWEVEGQKRG